MAHLKRPHLKKAQAKATQSISAETTVASRLLQEVFAGFDDGSRITVLDLGPGNADTIRFLSRYRARIIFADLLDNPVLSNPPEEVESTVITQQLLRQLAVPADTTIDICLLWDYLHYLDLPTVELLSRVLTPLLSHGAKGYGFGTLHGKKPDDTNQYGIAGPAELAVHPPQFEPKYHAHSQQRLGDRFPALRITRGTLLREGRLELLFERV